MGASNKSHFAIFEANLDRLLDIYASQANNHTSDLLAKHSIARSKFKKLMRETAGTLALKTCVNALSACKAEDALKIANQLLVPIRSLIPAKPKPTNRASRKSAPKRAQRAQPQADNSINVNSLEP